MANKWTVRAWELNEALSRIHCLPYIFYWDTEKAKLGYLQPNDQNYKLFQVSSFLTLAASLTLLFAAIWKSSHKLETKWACICIWLLLAFGILLAFTFDMVLVAHAHRFVDSLNNVMVLLSELETSEGSHNVRRWGKLSNNDVLGLLGIGIVLFLHAVPIFLPLAMLPMQPEMDPLHSILQYYNGSNYQDQWNPILVGVWWTIIVLIWYVFLSCPFRAIAILGLTVILETPIFYDCLGHCKTFELDYSMLSRYDKFFRIRSINVKGCAAVLASALPIGFAIQIHEHIMCLYGHSVLNPTLYVLIVVITLGGDFVNYIMMTLGANLFEDANDLIENWKRDVYMIENSTKRKHIRKILQHFRPVCFRCGDFAILRRDTKKDYYSRQKDWFIDVMFMVKPIFHSVP